MNGRAPKHSQYHGPAQTQTQNNLGTVTGIKKYTSINPSVQQPYRTAPTATSDRHWLTEHMCLLYHWLMGHMCSLAAAGGGATGAMAPPLAHEGGAILSFGPTFDVKGKI